MSIKLHGGRIIPAPIARAYAMLMEAKPEARRIGERLQASWMTRRAVNILDKARMEGVEVDSPLITAWDELTDRMRKQRSSSERDPLCDFSFELWLFPLRRRTLMMVNAEQREMHKWLNDLPFVSDYGYWDNTDPDDDVAPRAWRQRRKDWLTVLPWGAAPSDRCLNMVMFNDQMPMPPSNDEMRPHIPQVAERLATAAENRHCDEIYRRLLEEKKAADPEYKPTGFGLFFKARDVAKTEVDRREEIKAELAPAIREIVPDDLMTRRRG